MGLFGLFGKDKKSNLSKGLFSTRENLFQRITGALLGKATLDEEALEQLEEILISADIGVETSLSVLESLRVRVREEKKGIPSDKVMDLLSEEIKNRLSVSGNESEWKIEKGKGPFVIMVVGVNGVGKTTTIGKLAHQFSGQGYSVILGAADTFRAAATEQLKVWGTRAGVPVVSQKMGADPASVAFDTVSSAKAKGADIAIIDTAGRLHNKAGLMEELSKIKRVMTKVIPEAPHQVLLVLDGSTGQNALNQCREFLQATEVTSLAITKLDGTAKGGVVVGIADQFRIPVKFIGVGEGMEDLQEFVPDAFADALIRNTQE